MQLEQWQRDLIAVGELYRVGGMLRDLEVGGGEQPADVDFVVRNIEPETLIEILSRYGKVQLVGRFFGVYKFHPRGAKAALDIAYPRREVSTGPGHRDFKIDWDWRIPIEEDLSRRDFTINAIAQNLRSGEIIDPLDGRSDIKKKIVRMVFEGAFLEDPLRILRGVRFAACLGFDIEDETFEAMKQSARLVSTISPERVRDELSKLMLKSSKPSRGFILMQELGVLEILIPELSENVGVSQNEFHPDDVFMHSLRTCDAAEADDLMVRWAALLHDLGKGARRQVIEDQKTGKPRVVFYRHEEESARIAVELLSRLRYGKAFVSRCKTIILNHMFNYQSEWKAATVRRFIKKVGEENLAALFALRVADCRSRGLESEVQELRELQARIDREVSERGALSLKDLAVNGDDVKSVLGISGGPKVGEILRELLEEVIDDPTLNDREALLSKLRKRKPL